MPTRTLKRPAQVKKGAASAHAENGPGQGKWFWLPRTHACQGFAFFGCFAGLLAHLGGAREKWSGAQPGLYMSAR